MQTGLELSGSTTSDGKEHHNVASATASIEPSSTPSLVAPYTTRQLVVNIGAVLLKAMAKVFRNNPEILSLLFVGVLFVVVLKFAQNSGASQSPAIPSPIFPKDSPVFEFNDGNMQNAMLRIQREDNEFSFVMYYAHWDGNSQDIAVEFDKAARQLSHQVTFIAVNCWWMHGSCRHRVKTTMFPTLLATVPTVHSGIQYTGIFQADEMVAFLHRLCRPLTYLTDMHELYRLHAQQGTVVVGYFDWSSFPLPPGLASFQKAAWLALEKDVIDPIAFAVVTNSTLGRSLGLEQSQSISMIRALNSSVLYPKDAKFRAKLIMEWALKHRESLVEWLAPAGVKSTIMASQIDHSPAVILFTSHNHWRGLLNDYYWFKEIALDYYNCYNSSLVQNIVEEIHSARSIDDDKDENSPDCDDGNPSDNTPVTCDCCQTLADIPFTLTTAHGRNVCQVCEQSSRSQPTSCNPSLHHNQATLINFIIRGKASLAPNSCLHMNYYYSPFRQLQLCCKQCDSVTKATCSQRVKFAFSEHEGMLSHDSLCQGVLSRTDCHSECNQIFQSQCSKDKWNRSSNTKTAHQSHSSRMLDPQESVVNIHLGPFTGLGCRTNRTVNFFAMRSEYFWQFAEQLGVSNISGFDSYGGKMAVVLLDKEAEQQHFLAEDITATSIKHFIFNYTSSNLTRHLRSSNPNIPNVCSTISKVCVQEVVSSTFEELVLDNTKDVLLLYYAPWCGFCARMNHLYLMLAKVFQNSSDLLIARINGDANDLPWHLTPSSYPTLLLFPAGHKDQSLQFPPSAMLNLPNMIHFVLQHSSVLH